MSGNRASDTVSEQRAEDAVLFAPWPWYPPDEIQAAADALASGKVNYWTGSEGRTFEAEYARSAGCRHGIALANGTAALELALVAFGIGPGDEVITTARTFIASASAAVMRGATPVVADVDRDSQNVTAATIEPLITARSKAIIPVHLAGWPCEMDEIVELARAYGLIVIEDCAQASGALLHGRAVGSFGHAGAFSFCQDKIITTGGEGGMLTTNDSAAWERAWSFKDHGKSYAAVYERDHPPGYRWLHESFGTNWRMTEPQAAIGRRQLAKLGASMQRRRAHAAILSSGFETTPGLRVTRPPEHVGHAYYKYYAFVEPQSLRSGWDRDRIVVAVAERGVPCLVGSCSEIYREVAFRKAGFGPSQRLPVARELGETALMFLVHPTLDERAIERTCEVVREVMSEAVR